MTRPARSCCGMPARKGKKKEPAIPGPIQADLDRIGGLKALAGRIPAEEELGRESRIHHALSDPLRLAIMYLLMDQPLCVCVIKEFTQIADSKLSYHLAILRESGLVEGTYQGNWIIYSITDKGRDCTGIPGTKKKI